MLARYRNPLVSFARCVRRVAITAGVGLSVLSGCASPQPGASYMTVERSDYPRAFDAASEAARAEGLVPELSDRETGRLSTAAREAGSLIEPWTWGDLTASDLVSGTLGFERRRAHFEFIPVGFRPTAAGSDAPLSGPVLPGSERAVGMNLADGSGEDEGALELRVTVSIERRFRPGYQGNPYTRALGSFSRDEMVTEDEALAARDRSVWTPVARDERLERVLIARIADRLAAGSPASDDEVTRSADR